LKKIESQENETEDPNYIESSNLGEAVTTDDGGKMNEQELLKE